MKNKHKTLKKLLGNLVVQVNKECNSNKHDYVKSSKLSYMEDYTKHFFLKLEEYERNIITK